MLNYRPAGQGKTPYQTMTPEQLNEMIKAAGISRRELARRLDVTERQVYQWLAGRSPITGPTRIALETVLAPKK